jgi:hypothetical protein
MKKVTVSASFDEAEAYDPELEGFLYSLQVLNLESVGPSPRHWNPLHP